MSAEIIIADSSCLIVLENIRELTLLQKLFGEILITEEVKDEFGIALPEWMKFRNIKEYKTELESLLTCNFRLVYFSQPIS